MNGESNAFPVIPSIVLSTAHYEQMKQQIESLTREKAAVGELLAVVHRDGGHYESEHGTVKAIQDATQVYYTLRAELDAINELAKQGDIDGIRDICDNTG